MMMLNSPPIHPDMSLYEDDLALWQQFVESRDNDLRILLIEKYLPIARIIAASLFAKRVVDDVDFVDYMQYATLGLIEAVDRFDPQKGNNFRTFATYRIQGSILNNLENLSERQGQVYLRRRLQVERLESFKHNKVSKSPSKDLFADLAEIAIGLALSYMLEGSGMLLAEDKNQVAQENAYNSLEQRQMQQSLLNLVEALPEREKKVIEYHYFQGLEFQEISRLLNITKGRVSQIHRQGLLLLKEAYINFNKLSVRY